MQPSNGVKQLPLKKILISPLTDDPKLRTARYAVPSKNKLDTLIKQQLNTMVMRDKSNDIGKALQQKM